MEPSVAKNYMYFERSPPSFFFRAKRGENFLCDSNTRAFRAEGAVRIFFQKLDPETAKKSLCKIAFFLTKHSILRLRRKFSKNHGEESILGARAAVYRGATVLFGAEDGAARI